VAGLDIRTLDPGDLDQVADLGAHSFGGPRTVTTVETRAVPPEDTIAAYEGARLVGTAAVHRFRQWWGGKAVPCGGVAGVMVAPDQRGTGLSRTLLAEATSAMLSRGEPISALYPTTASLYRSVGYEVAGWWGQRAVSVRDLPTPSGDVTWAPTTPADPAVAVVQAACAEGRDGWVVPPQQFWVGWAHRQQEGTTWTWVGRRPGSDDPVAAVSYGHAKGERALFDIDAPVVLGVDGPALADALAFLGGNGTTGDRVRTPLPGPLLARHVPQASRIPTLDDWPWMLRLIDLPGAMAARGWPSGLDLEVHLDVTPPERVPDDRTAGRWVLRIADGDGTCAPGGDGTASVAVSDLASLYSGHLDPAQLVTEGRLRGATDRDVSGLRAAFAGHPSLPIFF
jgi:GNAT superfamily N-acetyltransferase